MSVNFKNFLNILLLLIVLVLALEFCVRMVDVSRGYPFFSNNHRNAFKKISRPLIPYTVLGWQLYEREGETKTIKDVHGNSYPLEKKQGTYRIILFGEATLENTVDGNRFSVLLHDALQKEYAGRNIEVITLANSKFATTHSLILLMFDAVSWDPDLLIVSHNINDLLAAYFPDFTPDYSNKYGTKYYLPKLEQELTKTNAFFEWSNLYWFSRDKVRVAFSGRNREKPHQHVSYGSEPPKEASDVFRRNLGTFAAVAHTNRIPLIFATQPLEKNDSPDLWDKYLRSKDFNEVVRFPAHEELILHHKRFNDIVAETAHTSGSYFLDLNAAFAGEARFFADYLHYSGEGVKEGSRKLSEYIISQKLIQHSI